MASKNGGFVTQVGSWERCAAARRYRARYRSRCLVVMQNELTIRLRALIGFALEELQSRSHEKHSFKLERGPLARPWPGTCPNCVPLLTVQPILLEGPKQCSFGYRPTAPTPAKL